MMLLEVQLLLVLNHAVAAIETTAAGMARVEVNLALHLLSPSMRLSTTLQLQVVMLPAQMKSVESAVRLTLASVTILRQKRQRSTKMLHLLQHLRPSPLVVRAAAFLLLLLMRQRLESPSLLLLLLL